MLTRCQQCSLSTAKDMRMIAKMPKDYTPKAEETLLIDKDPTPVLSTVNPEEDEQKA